MHEVLGHMVDDPSLSDCSIWKPGSQRVSDSEPTFLFPGTCVCTGTALAVASRKVFGLSEGTGRSIYTDRWQPDSALELQSGGAIG